jgi:hypothetical protein
MHDVKAWQQKLQMEGSQIDRDMPLQGRGPFPIKVHGPRLTGIFDMPVRDPVCGGVHKALKRHAARNPRSL